MAKIKIGEIKGAYIGSDPDITGLKATNVDAALSEVNGYTKKEYGLFVDNRSQPSTGYWHKIFTCRIKVYHYTDISIMCSVLSLYNGGARINGDLCINVRQEADGGVNTVSSKMVWLNGNIDLSDYYLKHFAINVVGSGAGNYVELYIYNDTQYKGYKVNVIDKSYTSDSTLTFTGEVNWNATTTLTSLPTNGTIIYSTLGYYLQSIVDMRAAIVALGGTV